MTSLERHFGDFRFRHWRLVRISSFGFRISAWGIAATLAFISNLHAHEIRPAYLELRETAPGQFSVVWRTPVMSGMRLPVALKLPGDVQNLRDPVVQEMPDSLVERRWVMAGPNGLAGKRIEFPGLQLTITDVLVRFEMLNGAKGTVIVRPSQPWMEMAATQTRWNVAGTYLRLGIEHIWTGIDHLLFVLALLLLVRGWRRVVATITAFTVAHSITLAVATLGFVRVPQQPVEATIALSIVFVAAEIVHARQGKPGWAVRWPWLIAFAFGLLHGFGFASALNQVGLPQNAIPVALLFFNLGVEAGQLLFIAAVVVVIALARKLAWAVAISPPTWAWRVAPYAIGSVAAFWLVQRIAAFAP
jgi:hydrogenase/urease accessory protein HupE